MSDEKKILFIDDEESILEIGRLMLEHAGYQVITALDGETALATYKSDSNMAVVVLDLSLPGMSGRQILEGILAINPQQKVIVSSGFDNSSSARELMQLGVDGFLPKPYRMECIVNKIREVIETEKVPDQSSHTNPGMNG